MTETETYVIHARTDRSAMSFATQDPADALKRAKDMAGRGSTVTITDRGGNIHTVEELEAIIQSGAYVRPGSSDQR